MEKVKGEVWLEGAFFGLQWGSTASADFYLVEEGESQHKVALASIVSFEDEPTSDMLLAKCRFTSNGRTFSGTIQPKREERMISGGTRQITMIPHPHEEP